MLINLCQLQSSALVMKVFQVKDCRPETNFSFCFNYSSHIRADSVRYVKCFYFLLFAFFLFYLGSSELCKYNVDFCWILAIFMPQTLATVSKHGAMFLVKERRCWHSIAVEKCHSITHRQVFIH